MNAPSPPSYLHIAFAADRNFSVPLALACLSLIRAAAEQSKYHIHILGDQVEEEIVRELKQLCSTHGHLLSYHDVAAALKSVVQTDYFPSVAFGRFLLPELLDSSIERVIYSDSDVMICRDLADLYELDMGDRLLGAVQELAPVWNKDFEQNFQHWAVHFGHDKEAAYYCYSGFLLFNLPRCRELSLSRRVLEHALSSSASLAYPDQDIMNGLCQGQLLALPQRYCMIPHLHAYYHAKSKEVSHHPRLRVTQPELAEAASSPSIIHFASSSKPFVLFPPSGGNAPFYDLWLSSPWKHRLPYLPHRMRQGISQSQSGKMKAIATLLRLATFVPGLYKIWWSLAKHIPHAFKKRTAKFFEWSMP